MNYLSHLLKVLFRQRAVASRPNSTAKAFLIGGLAWYVLSPFYLTLLIKWSINCTRFAIPFTFATTLGLAAVALHDAPNMKVLTPTDVAAGLPASAAARTLLGQRGAAAILVLVFLAVTSAASAEMIAVSSILTYDVYVVCLLFIHHIIQISCLSLIDIFKPSGKWEADHPYESSYGLSLN
jgi:Na+/proline symporter